MLRLVFPLLLVQSALADWPQWRGPVGDGNPPAGQSVPTSFSETENVLWKVAVSGRGHSSPTIVGDRLLLTTADEVQGTQSVLCFETGRGKLLWRTTVLTAGLPKKIHKKNTHASPTVACDGERAFALFYSTDGGLHLVALGLEQGEELWRVQAGDFISEYPFGYGASPILAGDNILVVSDFKAGWLAAFDRGSGKEAWRTPRHLKSSSYSSPVVATVGGQKQILLSGSEQVAGYNPRTGARLWSIAGGMAATAGSLLTDGRLVFASGGYPSKATWAVDPASGSVVWEHKTQCYEQSMVLHEGHLFAVAEGGIAYCWESETGELRWRERLGTGAESASPVLVGEYLYACNERGQVFVFRADPNRFELVATNQLGTEIFATPTVLENRIYLRAATGSGVDRRETLYCIGAK